MCTANPEASELLAEQCHKMAVATGKQIPNSEFLGIFNQKLHVPVGSLLGVITISSYMTSSNLLKAFMNFQMLVSPTITFL